jgi:flagellin-like protein
MDPQKVTRLLVPSGIIGSLIFVAMVIVLGALTPGYSHASQAISELGAVGAPYAASQAINFAFLGMSLLLFAVGLHYAIGGGTGSKVGIFLLGGFAVSSAFGSAVFPCDVGCEFVTVSGTLHNVLGLLGFLMFAAGTIVLSRRMAADDAWRRYRRYSQLTGVLAIVALVVWIAGKNAAPAIGGGLQRVMVGVILAWIVTTSVHAVRLARAAPRTTGVADPVKTEAA